MTAFKTVFKTVPLGDVCDVISGQSPPSTDYNMDGLGLPFYQGKTDFGDRYPSPRVWCSKPLKTAEKGDILFCVRAPVGPTNIANENCCIGRGLAAVRAGKHVDRVYLLHYFRHVEPKFEKFANGSTFKAITLSDLSTFQIPLPPLPEQRRIAAILDKADALRRKRAEALTLADDFLKSVFLDMFGDPVTNPKGWETTRIGELTEVKTGRTPTRKAPQFFNGNIPWVKTGEVDGRQIMETEEHVSEKAVLECGLELFPPNSILIAMYGQGLTRGRSAILGVPATTNQACAIILPTTRISPQYLFRLVQISYSEFRNLGRGGNQPNLNLSMVRDFEIPLPPLSLQERYSRVESKLEDLRKSQRKNRESTDGLFDSLSQRAFRGEL